MAIERYFTYMEANAAAASRIAEVTAQQHAYTSLLDAFVKAVSP
jgi:hypothetical protein